MAFSSVRLLSLVAITVHPAFAFANLSPWAVPAASLPLSFTPLFTTNLTLGKPSNPIPIPGGILITEPLTGGTISGASINATIESGFGHPPFYENNTLEVAVIDGYGTTSDGQTFYLHEEGVGSGDGQVTRVVSLLDKS